MGLRNALLGTVCSSVLSVVRVQENAVPGKTPHAPPTARPSSHLSTPCSPSSLIPPPCLSAPLLADIPLPVPLPLFPIFLPSIPPAPPSPPTAPAFPPTLLFSLPSYCHCLCLFTATSNGFRSIKGTQRSLLVNHSCGRAKPCTQGSAVLIIK